MKKIVIYLFSCIVFLGCNSIEKPKKPKNLIPKDKMVEIMFDVLVLNAAKGVQKITLETNGVFPEDYIYSKYSIDSLQFAISNNYYAYDADAYKTIIDEVNTRVETTKEKLEALRLEDEKALKAKKDSIKKAEEILKPVKMVEKFEKIKNKTN